MSDAAKPLEVAYLDRDGTINVDRHYLATPEGFAFCDGAPEGLADLAAAGLDLVVITNQSGIARGYFDQAALDAIHGRMRAELAHLGLSVAGIYVCPHGPTDDCACRKPRPGLILAAEANLGRRPGVMIGDSARDVFAGRAAGLMTIRIANPADPAAAEGNPDHVAPSLAEAARWVAQFNATLAEREDQP